MRLELVDEYRLLVYPVILGSGKRLFQDEIDTRHLRLVSSRAFGSGIVLLVYEPGELVEGTPYVDEFAWTQEQVRSLHAAQDTTRVLATILFTDIVDSTRRAAELGDRAWRQLLDRHDELARKEVDRWHGQFVKNTGDGCLATFDAPTRALQCAFSLRDALDATGTRDPGRHPHRRGRAARGRCRWDRRPHRRPRPGRGRSRFGGGDADRA